MDASGLGFVLGFSLLFGGALLYYLGEQCMKRRRRTAAERAHLLEQALRPKIVPNPKPQPNHWKLNTLFIIGKPNFARQNGQRKIIVLS